VLLAVYFLLEESAFDSEWQQIRGAVVLQFVRKNISSCRSLCFLAVIASCSKFKSKN
jgi:hypothetical protein